MVRAASLARWAKNSARNGTVAGSFTSSWMAVEVASYISARLTTPRPESSTTACSSASVSSAAGPRLRAESSPAVRSSVGSCSRNSWPSLLSRTSSSISSTPISSARAYEARLFSGLWAITPRWPTISRDMSAFHPFFVQWPDPVDGWLERLLHGSQCGLRVAAARVDRLDRSDRLGYALRHVSAHDVRALGDLQLVESHLIVRVLLGAPSDLVRLQGVGRRGQIAGTERPVDCCVAGTEELQHLPGGLLPLLGGIAEDGEPAASGRHAGGDLLRQEAATVLELGGLVDAGQRSGRLGERRGHAGDEVAGGVGGEVAEPVFMDELSIVLQRGNRLLCGQEQVQALRVSAAERPAGALEVPVVGTRIGAHRDVGTVRPVALELQAPLAELLVGLRCPVWQADVGEDVSVEVEQRRGPAERNPPDVALHRALGDELFVEGLGAEGVVEVAGERFQGLVEVEPVPDHVAEYRDVGNLLGLQAR